MEAVFVDTDVIINSLGERAPYEENADMIFSLADTKEIEVCISSLSYSNVYYILHKDFQPDLTIKKLRTLSTFTTTLEVNSKIIQLALNSDFNDFEDAIQYYAAIEGAVNIIITRNIKHYKKSKISVLTPESYINTKIQK